MSKAHPGFKAVQKSIASRSGVSEAAAGRILGSATRKASAAAKRANPRLKRVKGSMHGGGTVPETGAYVLKAGEKVTATKEPGKTMIFSGADRPMRPMPTNRECVPHQEVEAMPNTDGGMHAGHWEIDGTDTKLVK